MATARICAASARTTRQVELADVFGTHGEAYAQSHRLNRAERKVMRAIVTCRTSALGGQRDSCPRCGYTRYRYHSCRNRHCPKCRPLAKAQWLVDRQRELLPTPYFHNVFTLPHELNALALTSERNRRALWGLLFRATAETLLAFGRNNLGGTPGFTLVLHTWDQQLRPHCSRPRHRDRRSPFGRRHAVDLHGRQVPVSCAGAEQGVSWQVCRRAQEAA